MKLYIIFLLLTGFYLESFTQNKVKVIGFVKDNKTEEKLIGALISLEGIGITTSDSTGFFEFLLKPGKYLTECKYIGYKNSLKDIKINNENIDLIFHLKPLPIEIQNVTITGEQFSETQNFKTYELQKGDLYKIPVFLESDALRPLQALPGVTTIHDLSSLIYLRGGNYDETIITLDDVPVYNSYHLGGIFGSFNTDIVEREILYPSNYPVKYQGALSGILNIFTKNGNSERIKGIASAGLVSSKLFLEGPLAKGNFIFSARRTYPDIILNLLSKSTFPYYFYDFNGKYSIPIDNNNLISISGFYSKDIYKLFVDKDDLIVEKKDDLNWGNRIGQITYSNFFDDGAINFNLYYSSSFFRGNAKGFSTKSFQSKDLPKNLEHIIIDNKIKDITITTGIDLKLTGQEIDFAGEFKSLSTSYYWDINEREISNTINGDFKNIFLDFAPNRYTSSDYSNIFSFYLSDRILLTPEIDLLVGYRGLYVNKIEKYLSSPYLLTNYKLNSSIKLSFSYGRYYQYFFTKRELTNSSYFSPFAIYFLGDKTENIPSSEHFSLGFTVKDLLPSTKLEIEGYYKKRNNVISSDELTEVSSYIDGYSAGLDILIKHEEGKINGWIAYSYSHSIKNNSEYSYFNSYDRTHDFKVLLNYRLFESWRLNSFWIYSSGMPFTPVIGKFVSGTIGEPIQLIYGRKNTSRYTDYHRLDIGFTGNFIWWDAIIAKPYLQIMNVYNSKNPFNYEPSPYDINLEDGMETGSMIIPTIGIILEF